jgi:nondiscriminating glutamyl-tRNA synthetase
MLPPTVRVRFAPSPTGAMHLGNVRAALINYLFAHQKQGTFILRIEDTDPQRNFDPYGKQIMADLNWLHLTYDEGPGVGGNYGPYYQSERTKFYQEHLKTLETKHLVYHCFCSTDTLEKKRERQIALKQPPRYDRTCLQLSPQELEERMAANTPFIWRFKLSDGEVTVTDLARGEMRYQLKNFSDFPITRQDGSFTFVFANFVDDLMMKITHVFRGEEHISSTALQAAMYNAFNHPIPVFWHFPIICNAEGKKLSKRDFGFSLKDLQDDGFLPEAIVNYLAIIGASYEHEIMPINELARLVDFEKTASAGFIRYDVEKLRWINHKWLELLPLEEVAKRCRPFLEKKYPQAGNLSDLELAELLKPLRTELTTLADSATALKFYFERPEPNIPLALEHDLETYRPVLKKLITEYKATEPADEFFSAMSLLCKESNLKLKDFYVLVRIALTGKAQGQSIKELLAILPVKERIARLEGLLG